MELNWAVPVLQCLSGMMSWSVPCKAPTPLVRKVGFSLSLSLSLSLCVNLCVCFGMGC